MSTSEKDKDKTVKIHIDDSALLETGKKLGELEQRLDEVEGKDKDEAFDLDAKRKELAHDFNDNRFLNAENKKELAEMVRDIVKETQALRAEIPAPSGTPNTLNDAQWGRSQETELRKMTFANNEAMISYLKEHEKTDPECKAVLNELWKRTVLALQKGETISYNSTGDNPATEEGKSPVQVELTGQEVNNPNSELQQYLAKANERAREQARQRSQNYYLETEAEAQKQKERNKRVS
jgi:hypothetical protein